MSPAASRYERSRQWARHWLVTTRNLSAGLMLCFLTADRMQAHLPAGSGIAIAFSKVMMVAAVWLLLTPLAALGLGCLLWVQFTREERGLGIALAGCLWGAIYPLTVAWSNSDRVWLGLFISGSATAAQGAVQLAPRL